MNRAKKRRAPEKLTRETHLPTEQIGAQAPARLSCPHGDERRTPGCRRAARTRAQAAQCVIGTPVPSLPWSGCDGGAIFVPPPAVCGRREGHLFCRHVGAATKARFVSDSPYRDRWAMPSSATAS